MFVAIIMESYEATKEPGGELLVLALRLALPLPRLSLILTSPCLFCVLWFNYFCPSRAGGPDLVSMLEESLMKPMQENFQAMMRKLR